MSRLLIVGASSFIGANLCKGLREKYQLYGTYYEHRPLIDGVNLMPFPIEPGAPLDALIEKLSPDAVIYCPAWREVGKCEADPLGAQFLHAEAPSRMQQTLDKLGGRFFYLSTSKVFPGERGQHRETDLPEPKDVYGQTKLRGERAIQHGKDYVILRLGTVYGFGGFKQDSVLNQMLKRLTSKDPVPLVCDEFRTFTLVDEITTIVEKLLLIEKPINEIFHVANKEKDTYYSFATQLAKATGADSAERLKLTSEEFFSRYCKGHAKHRYQNLTLSGEKLEDFLSLKLEPTPRSLARVASQLAIGNF